MPLPTRLCLSPPPYTVLTSFSPRSRTLPPPPLLKHPPSRPPAVAGGDDTVRTRVYDMAAAVRPHDPIEWPEPYDASGVASNDFTAKWHARESSLDAELSIRFAGLISSAQISPPRTNLLFA